MEISRSDLNSAEPDFHQHNSNNTSTMHDFDTNSPPNSRLFVVCSKSFSEDDLKEIFSEYGSIQDVYIVREKTASRGSKGVCFIKFLKSSDACRAMEELNGKHVKDSERPIKVLMAQSRNNERAYPSGGSQSHGFIRGQAAANFAASEEEQMDNLLRLFVTVDKKQTQEQVKEYFAKFGLVDHVHILKDKETGESRGVAYVKYYRASHAALALEEAGNEYKAILADPRPHKNTGSLSTSSASQQTNNSYPPYNVNTHPSYNNNGSYNVHGVYGSKNATDTSSVNPQQNYHHTGYSPHQVFHGYNSGTLGAMSSTGQQAPITPLFPPPPTAAAAHVHPIGNAGAGLTAMLQQMAACGDDGASNGQWISSHANSNTTAPLHASQTLPTFDHINGACRTLGYNSCRIQAFVDHRATESQLRAIFDLIPGLEHFQLSGDARKPNSHGLVFATYSTPFAALYAKERLNAIEFPMGSRMTVKFMDDAYNGSNSSRYPQNSNQGVLNSTQVFNLQMTRAMAMGVMSNMPSSCINAINLSNGAPAMIKSNASPKTYQSASVPMPNMGTGDSPQQEMDMVNGVRGYFYPGGINNMCASAESYPSFTSSSSNGSATIAPALSKSTNAVNQSLSNSTTCNNSNQTSEHSTSRRQKRGPNTGNSSGHNRRNNSTGALKNGNDSQSQRNFVSSANNANSNSTGNVNAGLTNGTINQTATVASTGTY